jgi:hypothetical protein
MKTFTFTFNEKEAGILQLALEVFIKTLDGKNDASFTITESLAKRLRDYVEEAFASVHSQGG